MSKLLIDDYPIQVLPKLANAIGLNEAIVLQQIHYWINKKTNFKDERYWVYNTLKELNDQFPFWSQKTIQRTISSLKNKELLITGNYNKAGFDKTVWYSIDYFKLSQYENLMSTPCGQNDHTRGTECPNGRGQNDHTNTLDFTKTSTKNICSNEFERLWSMYPKKQGNKGTALKNYVKARSGKNAVSYEFVEEALKKAISYWKTSQTETKFIPMAATWFNQNRWNDELVSESSNATVANRPELNDWEQTRKEMGL
ncbi:hypothetical protein [Carnobacterium maltaromaticum]|uniref:hypothetical protein n=1 Tax=Carnobacterium maltaromaticum TaxID=2751 RepID=UPI0012F8805E|nr:hypothetical protein [Carnobacterium maltaromaticum]